MTISLTHFRRNSDNFDSSFLEADHQLIVKYLFHDSELFASQENVDSWDDRCYSNVYFITTVLGKRPVSVEILIPMDETW